MKFALLLFAHVLGVQLQMAAAQSVVDYTKLPDCAHQCSVLAQAEANCVPPAAPVTQQAIYQSCVCQSTLLTGLHSSGAQCQQTGCSADDAQKISQYYIALCNGPVVQPVATSTTKLGTTTSSATSKPTSTSKANGAGANGGVSTTEKKNDWFSTHWRWVVMAIVIFLAIPIIWIGGIFLRRRHDRKKDAKRANLAASDGPYNPSTPGQTTPASKSTVNHSVPPTPPMTMSGANGMDMNMDGGVGGITPRRGVPSMRTRSGTLQSLGLSNASRTTLPPEPVVWGPHQHFAHTNGSPTVSGPPSPTFPADIHPVFRNNDALRSEPRLGGIVFHDSSRRMIAPGGNGFAENGHLLSTSQRRPRTASSAERFREGPARGMDALRPTPVLAPHQEGQVAEIAEASPQKTTNKLRKA